MVGWLTGWRDIILEYGIQNTHRIHRFVYIQTKNCKLLFHVLICCALLCFAFVRWVYEILLISRYSAPANSLNNALERNGTCLKKPRLEERISYRKENGKLFFLFSCSFFSSIEKTHNSRFNKKIKANNWDCQLKNENLNHSHKEQESTKEREFVL